MDEATQIAPTFEDHGATIVSIRDWRRQQKILRQLRKQITVQDHPDIDIDIDLEFGGTSNCVKVMQLRDFHVRSGIMNPCGFASMALAEYLAKHWGYMRGMRCLDLGCGSGLQGVIMMLAGAESVMFADIQRNAVENAIENVVRLQDGSCRTAYSISDVFDGIPRGMQFDTIVFNHPFFQHPRTSRKNTRLLRHPSVKSMVADASILERFFSEVGGWMSEDANIFMPFLHLADNDPREMALSHGFQCEEVSWIDGETIQNSEISIYMVFR